MRKFLTSVKVIVCHNAKRFDVPVFERLLGIKITAFVIDSLALSWYLYPERKKHGLEEWGEHFGVKKPVILDWHELPIEDYINRCEQDVRINWLLWKDQFSYLLELYGSQKKVWEFLKYISFKMDCAALQEKAGWKVDVPYLEKSLKELENLKEEKTKELTAAMPRVPIKKKKAKPKRFLNKDGTYSKLGQEWVSFLAENGLPPDHEEDVEYHDGSVEGNPNSPEQVKEWLYSLGWVPETFNYQRDKNTGNIKETPKINLDHGKGICPSIKKLFDKEPNLALLDGLSVISHRIGCLKSIKSSLDDRNYTKAQIKGFTNTLRVRHTTVVNLPKADRAYAEPIRGCLIAEEGYELCGSDMASLEDRIKQHFLYFYDPDYVDSMNQEGYDPHLVIAVIAEMCTQEDADNYKFIASLKDDEKETVSKSLIDWAKRIKPIRDVAKNGNYACQYLAGVARLALTCGITRDKAQKLYDAYWKLNWAIKQTAEDQRVKTIREQMWLFNPISKFWYSLRFVKDVFSTLVQGTASYLFDMWIKGILDKRPQLTATFHDEGVWQIKKGHREECSQLIKSAIDKLNEQVKLNKKLDISIQFGDRYSEIH